MLDDDTMSNLSVGGKKLTWREAAEHYRERAARAEQFRSILFDLDRCLHGRHEGDVCSGCNGPSVGNPLVDASRLLGFDLSGRDIVLPAAADMGDPDAWRES